jgi:hypothetical protein
LQNPFPILSSTQEPIGHFFNPQVCIYGKLANKSENNQKNRDTYQSFSFFYFSGRFGKLFFGKTFLFRFLSNFPANFPRSSRSFSTYEPTTTEKSFCQKQVDLLQGFEGNNWALR